VIIAHEIIHEFHKKNNKGLVLKKDYEKAYVKVNRFSI
jgi:hypothetical protein